ncbi:MAG TPA: tRNA (adenosine(37)-N6)-threonylcarbamoyltransferase complex dimerization subunit type 1 TsaB [Firmicutes bacterium]|jgi:tRNA threonylcarbamoyladenosine biosynthesis protein TsaB|nr:tRNA (adenosine(37)-N6)-threonylcarbamoyltransferase complex dimerization subunit type 1 TsaB [Bacillota bacterium]
MLILGFDTATPWGTMALINDDQIIFEISLKAGKGSGEYLLALLQTLLKRAERKIADLDLIAVGTGPGSYTGIRIGLAAAKGLALGKNIKVFGVSTLRIIAENVYHDAEWIASVIDARHDFIYAALYHNINQQIQTIETPFYIKAEDFGLRLSSLPSVKLCGDASKIYQKIWGKYSNIKIAPSDGDRPLGSLVARIGASAFQQTGSFDSEQLIPCYLRKVEAEIRLEESLCKRE